MYLLSPRTRCDTRSIKRGKADFNSEFSFSKNCYLTKVKEPSLVYYLPIVSKGMAGFMSFPGALAWSKTLTATSKIWTRVADSIPYVDNSHAMYA